MNAPSPVTIGNKLPASLIAALEQQKKAREMPVEITTRDYADAVCALLKLARMDCGGSRAAAQVLLGLYSGKSYHVDLIDLCNLDAAHYRAAIIAIRGRVEIKSEPHELLKDGDRIFAMLQDQWAHLHVNKRYPSA